MLFSKDLDIVLLGATGYTGHLIAEHIAKTFPTSLKWGIGGRSKNNLEVLALRLKKIAIDRQQPEVVELEIHGKALETIVKRTHVVINAVGPYHRYSTPVLVACANAGTHYVDMSTETPWIKKMIDAYHETAMKNRATIIPAISLSSSPSDLLAFLVATSVQKNHPNTAIEVVTAGKLELNGMQGGSFATVLDTMATYGTSWLTGNPWGLSPRPKPTSAKALTFFDRLTGHRFVPSLGHLATSFLGISNESVVHRSAGLNPELYGPEFVYREYLPVGSTAAAVFVQLLTKFGIALLSLGFLRKLLRYLSFEPGSGPDLQVSRETEKVDFRTVAIEVKTEVPLVKAQFLYEGALTEVSAILAAEAAAVLLKRSKTQDPIGEFGVVTPSTLGVDFVDRIRNAGVKLSISEF